MSLTLSMNCCLRMTALCPKYEMKGGGWLTAAYWLLLWRSLFSIWGVIIYFRTSEQLFKYYMQFHSKISHVNTCFNGLNTVIQCILLTLVKSTLKKRQIMYHTKKVPEWVPRLKNTDQGDISCGEDIVILGLKKRMWERGVYKKTYRVCESHHRFGQE